MRFKSVHGHISLNVWGLSTAYFCGIGPVVVCKRATRASNSHILMARPCPIIQILSQFYSDLIQIRIKSYSTLFMRFHQIWIWKLWQNIFSNHSSSQQRLVQEVLVLTLKFEIPQVAYFQFLIIFLYKNWHFYVM